jgi:prepilin-type N-terminal cleavage/methylation domain-containing protein
MVGRKAFTLLEVLVVLSVIALMAASVGWCCVLGKNAAVKQANKIRARILSAVAEVSSSD